MSGVATPDTCWTCLTVVFGRFYRSGGALEKHVPGTGLGLDIVSSIVAAHDGAVTLESEVGVGSTLRVILPQPTV